MSDSTALAAASTASPVSDDAVGRALLRGVVWGGGSRWLAQLASWTATLFVARLLTPDDYGIVGMAAVLTGFLRVLGDLGLALAVVTLRELSARQIAQLHGLAILTGAAAFGVAALSGPVMAWFFQAPALTIVVPALAFALVVSGPRIVPAALLQRELRFERLSALEAVQALASCCVVLAAAWAGWGYWALVASTVVGSTVWTAITLASCAPAPAWPRRRDLGQALTFARRQLTGSLAWYAYSNTDFAVAGRVLGPAGLGLYTVAWTIARIVPERVLAIVLAVTPALFATMQHDLPALRRWLLRVTSGVAILGFPALVGLSLVSGDLLSVALGSRWTGAIVPLRLIALHGAFDVVTQVASRVLTAAGEVRFTMRIGILQLMVMPAAFVAGAYAAGPAGIAAAWVIVSPPIRLHLILRACRLLAIPASAYAAALMPAISGTLVMSASVAAAAAILRPASPPARLGTLVAIGIASYAITLFVVYRDRLRAAAATVRSAGSLLGTR